MAPVLTPLIDRDTLDPDAFARLLEYLVAGGSLFILGSTGEAPSLSHRLRKRLVDCASAVGDRVPLLVGISDSCFIESLELAEHSARAGATALVLAAP